MNTWSKEEDDASESLHWHSYSPNNLWQVNDEDDRRVGRVELGDRTRDEDSGNGNGGRYVDAFIFCGGEVHVVHSRIIPFSGKWLSGAIRKLHS